MVLAARDGDVRRLTTFSLDAAIISIEGEAEEASVQIGAALHKRRHPASGPRSSWVLYSALAMVKLT
jgi:hypothetical protein